MRPLHPALRPRPPGAIPAWIWRAGQRYISLPELARLRRSSRQAAAKYARRHPNLCLRNGSHTYVKDPEGPQ